MPSWPQSPLFSVLHVTFSQLQVPQHQCSFCSAIQKCLIVLHKLVKSQLSSSLAEECLCTYFRLQMQRILLHLCHIEQPHLWRGGTITASALWFLQSKVQNSIPLQYNSQNTLTQNTWNSFNILQWLVLELQMDFYILRDSNLYFTHQASSAKYTSSTTDFTDSHHIYKLWAPLGPTVPCSNWITLVVDGLAPDDFLNVFLSPELLPARCDAELKPQRVVQIREGMVLDLLQLYYSYVPSGSGLVMLADMLLLSGTATRFVGSTAKYSHEHYLQQAWHLSLHWTGWSCSCLQATLRAQNLMVKTRYLKLRQWCSSLSFPVLHLFSHMDALAGVWHSCTFSVFCQLLVRSVVCCRHGITVTWMDGEVVHLIPWRGERELDQYLVPTHPLCVVRVKKKKKNRKLKKPWKKGRRDKRPKLNLILSHVNHAFFILDPKPLDTLIVP